MPKAKNKKLSSVGHRLSYNEIKKLRVWELNRLCKQEGVDTSLPKEAKQTLLCHCLNVSTSGNKENSTPWQPRSKNHGLTQQQYSEFTTLKPEYLTKLTGWSKALHDMPDVDETKVKLYLRDTNEITPSMARMYKTTRPYKMKQFIHSMYLHSLPDKSTFIALRAQCNPSQNTTEGTIKVCFVIIDQITGDPVAGFCTCVVG